MRLREGHVGPITLILVLLKVCEVVAHDLAQAPELGSALVFNAKRASPVRRHGVQGLQLVVIAEDFEDSTISLPEKLEPGCHSFAISAVLLTFRRDRFQHEVLRGVLSLEITDRESSITGRGSGCGLRRFRLLRRKLQKVLNDLLERVHIDLLAHDPVLDEAVLREAPLLQFDAELDVLKHDRLQHLLPSSVTLRRDNIVKGLKRSMRLTNVDQLLLQKHKGRGGRRDQHTDGGNRQPPPGFEIYRAAPTAGKRTARFSAFSGLAKVPAYGGMTTD